MQQCVDITNEWKCLERTGYRFDFSILFSYVFYIKFPIRKWNLIFHSCMKYKYEGGLEIEKKRKKRTKT